MKKAVLIIQILLGLVFIMAGGMKLMMGQAEIVAQGNRWAEGFSEMEVMIIGILELLGGLGLILPKVLKMLPIMVPLAATGIALTMAGAVMTHISIGETNMIAPPIVLLLLAAFVAYSKFTEKDDGAAPAAKEEPKAEKPAEEAPKKDAPKDGGDDDTDMNLDDAFPE